MITGDGALTGADVARRLGMVTRPPKETLVLSTSPLEWQPLAAGYDGSDGGTDGGNGSATDSKPVPFSHDANATATVAKVRGWWVKLG